MKYTKQIPMDALNKFMEDFDYVVDLGDCDFLCKSNDAIDEYWVVFHIRVKDDTKDFESLAVAKYLVDPVTNEVHQAWGRKMCCYCYISNVPNGGYMNKGYELSNISELTKYYLNMKNA